MKKCNQLLIETVQNPKYKGKQVVIVGNEIRILPTKSKITRVKLLTSLIKKYPQVSPLITYIPKEDTLILLV